MSSLQHRRRDQLPRYEPPRSKLPLRFAFGAYALWMLIAFVIDGAWVAGLSALLLSSVASRI